MFWIHGGGYAYGAATSLGCDRTNLARTHAVAAVGLNHRLHASGFLDLPHFGGAEYAESANVGMPDIVAGLEQVRGDISRFGRDPDNVTIFGQSGGGGKVSTLPATPAAKGLFHKAIVERVHADADAA